MRGRRTICFDMSDVFCNVLNQFVALVSSIIVNEHVLPYLLSMDMGSLLLVNRSSYGCSLNCFARLVEKKNRACKLIYDSKNFLKVTMDYFLPIFLSRLDRALLYWGFYNGALLTPLNFCPVLRGAFL